MYPILSPGVRKTGPQEREIPPGEEDVKALSLFRRRCFLGRRFGLEACCCPDSADAHEPTIRCGIEHPAPND